ncbi:hypothetical protein [Actinoplanes palleronii]|uniref:hypothetical protein n=1 Tax=Actinoplanes palleronii TaxID=113570 RepID=UPI00194119CB|nr:hypothetical protein [Actinoplanes palleronii]
MAGAAATVSYLAGRWTLVAGEKVTVGRSSACTVQLPNDGHFSRLAVAIELVNGVVLVSNTSGSKPFVVRPPAGEDHVVAPRAAISPPCARFDIVLAGSRRDESVGVDASALRAEPGGEPAATRSADTFTGPGQFSAAQLRVVVELCRPLLTESGAAARPATYAEIGERLALSPQYVRNVLKAIRESLTGYGIPGLVSADQNPNDDFRLSLARWALWNGWVVAADLGDPRGK